MGLDMFVYRVKRPKLQDKVYTTKEIAEKGLMHVSVEDVKNDMSMFEQILPYAVRRNVVVQYYDVEKMISDYNLPKNSHIWCYSYNGINIGGYENNQKIDQFISRQEVKEKYTYEKTEPHYLWETEEESYWRKNYNLQEWFYEKLGNVENCGYYVLDAELIAETNRLYNTNIPEEDPTDDEVLTYHEWY